MIPMLRTVARSIFSTTDTYIPLLLLVLLGPNLTLIALLTRYKRVTSGSAQKPCWPLPFCVCPRDASQRRQAHYLHL